MSFRQGSQPKKLLVIGATGPLGREIVSEAISRGFDVTAFVRNPSAANLPSAVRVVKGDVLEPQSLNEAVQDQDAVVSVLGSKLTLRPITMLSEGTTNLIAAMEKTGVKRLVCVTGIGAGDSKGHGGLLYDWFILPLILREIYKDKTRQEEAIRASKLDWTIVRPSILTTKSASVQKGYRIATSPSGFVGKNISRAEVADFITLELLNGDYIRKAVLISK